MKARKTPFKAIVEKLADTNRLSLVQRASLANQLAKRHNGMTRRKFYDVKDDSLVAMIVAFPDKIRYSEDSRRPKMVVVRPRGTRRSFHIYRSTLWNFDESEISFG